MPPVPEIAGFQLPTAPRHNCVRKGKPSIRQALPAARICVPVGPNSKPEMGQVDKGEVTTQVEYKSSFSSDLIDPSDMYCQLRSLRIGS